MWLMISSHPLMSQRWRVEPTMKQNLRRYGQAMLIVSSAQYPLWAGLADFIVLWTLLYSDIVFYLKCMTQPYFKNGSYRVYRNWTFRRHHHQCELPWAPSWQIRCRADWDQNRNTPKKYHTCSIEIHLCPIHGFTFTVWKWVSHCSSCQHAWPQEFL